MGLVLGTRYVAPPPPPPPFQALAQTWTGWDGSLFDLVGGTEGVWLTGDADVIGLGYGPGELFSTSSPAVAGSTFKGSRDLERPVQWSIATASRQGSSDFIALERAFWRTMNRNRSGVWTVSLPGGETRTLTCRYANTTDALTSDPVAAGAAEYTVNLVANDPYWYGTPVKAGPFAVGSSAPFFGSGGPPFTISEASTFASATITNPGDVDAWPVWTIRDAATSVTLVVDGHTIATTHTLSAGDVAVIDTDPRRQSFTVNGTRVRGVLSPHNFAPIPAGETVPLGIAVVGSASVDCVIVPGYERAW